MVPLSRNLFVGVICRIAVVCEKRNRKNGNTHTQSKSHQELAPPPPSRVTLPLYKDRTSVSRLEFVQTISRNAGDSKDSFSPSQVHGCTRSDAVIPRESVAASGSEELGGRTRDLAVLDSAQQQIRRCLRLETLEMTVTVPNWQPFRTGCLVLHKNFHDRGRRRPHVPESVRRALLA